MYPYPCQPILTLTILLLILAPTTTTFQLQLLSPETFNKATKIYTNSTLETYYDDSEYNQIMTCTNGQLTIIQFLINVTGVIKMKYEGIQIIKENVKIQGDFKEPMPYVADIQVQDKIIVFASGCLGQDLTTKDNYFNKIDVTFTQPQQNGPIQYKFSFLLNCDEKGRNKKFQIGYIFITVINAAITIGVALHSRIWSIRYKGYPLSIQLKWHRFLIIMIVIFAVGIILYFYSADQFKNANNMLRYIGLFTAYVFSFICSDQILFLIRKFKKQVYKFIRICDVGSLITSTTMFIIGFFVQNWLYYNILAIGICVGAIKLLRFSTMKQAYLSMAISVIFVTVISGISHFILDRSYNDYASELSSPLFIALPDMVYQLYKKCSWLPVIDVIIPGVFLSFLRTYDENYNTGWGGVYTVIGNMSFIISTMLWIGLEAVYPYSVPFSLVTYSCLALAIFLMSYKRNQFKTLWTGRFNGANNEMTVSLLEENEAGRQTFGNMITQDIIDQVKFKKREDDEESQGHQQNDGQKKQKDTKQLK